MTNKKGFEVLPEILASDKPNPWELDFVRRLVCQYHLRNSTAKSIRILRKNGIPKHTIKQAFPLKELIRTDRNDRN